MKATPQGGQLERWVLFYRLLSELQTSEYARRAREIVFGGQAPETTCPPEQVAAVEKKLLKVQRDTWLAGYLITHPGSKKAKIYKSISVDRSDWYRYFRGELKDSSEIARRIREKICGESSHPPLTPHI